MPKTIELVIKINVNNDPNIKEIVNTINKDLLKILEDDMWQTKAALQSISTNVK